jgi:hypothetical protein
VERSGTKDLSEFREILRVAQDDRLKSMSKNKKLRASSAKMKTKPLFQGLIKKTALCFIFVALYCCQASAQQQILLIPIDDRPATTQFAEMIARIAGRQTLMPPATDLGRFTVPGSSQHIASWLLSFKGSKAEALVVSSDMLAYGGLIASRRHGIGLNAAASRLDTLKQFRTANPGVPVLAFSTIMRLAPTASATSASYHDALARYASLIDEAGQKHDRKLAEEAARLKAQVPKAALDDYLLTRKRNHSLNLRMLRMVRDGIVDFLILSQDDAKVYGLHRGEQRSLEAEIARLKLGAKAMLYAGADEVSNVLVSRAVLQAVQLKPSIEVVYSSEAGRKAVDPYEDRPIEESVRMQLAASGAVEATPKAVTSYPDRPIEESVRMQLAASGAVEAAPKAVDCRLFLHVPKTTPDEKRIFLQKLLAALREGVPVAIADIVWEPVHGGPDPELIEFLEANQVAHLVRAFASWNTAGNTLGTVIPQANMDVVLRQVLSKGDPGICESGLRANLEFLLHRYVNDWGYHDKVRMPAYAFIRDQLKGSTLELTADQYKKADAWVRDELVQVIRQFFSRNFAGKSLKVPGAPARLMRIDALDNLQARLGAPARLMRIDALDNLQARLPWPRPFEVEIRFQLRTSASKQETD